MGTMVHGLGGGARRMGRLVMVVCVHYRKNQLVVERGLCMCGEDVLVWSCVLIT